MGALFRTHKTTWRAGGKVVPKGTPGATPHRERSRKWYGQYRDGAGVVRRVALSENKAAAQSMLRDLVTRAERERRGLPIESVGPVSTPGLDLLAEYRSSLLADGLREGAHLAKVTGWVSRAFAHSGANTLAGLDRAKVDRFIGTLERSNRTVNDCVGNLRRFGAWLRQAKGSPATPFDHLKKRPAEGDRRRIRAELPPATFARLCEAAVRSSTVFRTVAGPDRAWIYRVAYQTGLRAGELSRLTPASFRLDESPPVVVLPGRQTKNRREARQPLPLDTALALRDYLASRPAGLPLWPGSWWREAAEMIGLDLAAAGAPLRDPDGRFYDFHALRHSFVSALGRAGVPIQDAQRLARHSTPVLTIGVYMHSDLARAAGEVDRVFGCTNGALVPLTGIDSIRLVRLAYPECNPCQEDGF